MSERSAITFRFKRNTSIGRQTVLFTEIFNRFGGGARTGASENLDQSFYVPQDASSEAIIAELKTIPEIDPDSVRLISEDAEQ